MALIPKFQLNDYVIVRTSIINNPSLNGKIGIVSNPKVPGLTHHYKDNVDGVFYSIYIGKELYWAKESAIRHIELTELEKLLVRIDSRTNI